ncbi:hypothetical protein [Kitasatospora sp. NPDC058190]|uniref:hypothetical protein n=1 Tax=Kitasatospora sp. NPDC058190 TaxID=3346371 RepID=UPI0036D85F06
MMDTRIYGKTCFTWTLGQGIEHGFLADHRVLVPVVTPALLTRLGDRAWPRGPMVAASRR